MKKCTTCGIEKKSNDFHVRRASKDGLSNKCKACQSEYDKGRSGSEKRKKGRLRYSKTPEGRAAGLRAKKKWAEKNIVKRAANILVGNAVRDGKIEKSVCEICSSSMAHAHHDDYAEPLNIRWLCSVHHQEWHAKNGEGKNARIN